MHPPPPNIEVDHLGLLAGEGDFPKLIARAARSRSVPVTAIGVENVTSPDLESEVTSMLWVKFGQFDRVIRLFQSHGISKTILAGRVKHSSIFELAKIDRRGMKMMARLANKKADSLLGVLIQEFEQEKIEVLDSTIFLRGCMPPPGLLTPAVPPSDEIREDIAFGIDLARRIAGMDIGQTVIVKSKTVVAVEAMEGTNGAIERGGEVAGDNIVVVKVSKPEQDKRFDIPVVGRVTIEKMVQAKAAALAFPGNEILFFDQEETVELAAANNICILAL